MKHITTIYKRTAIIGLLLLLIAPMKSNATEMDTSKVELKKSVMIPMRDGIRLSTDLYWPKGSEKDLPVILIRTPYNKNSFRNPKNDRSAIAYMFASNGFVVAIQDCRGKHESEGIYSPPAGQEAEDGYDAVDWLSKQEWGNGNVGTFGCSYLGEVQAAQAPLMHPNLKCMVPQNGPMIGAANGQYRYWSGWKGGAFDLAAGIEWYLRAGVKYSLKPPQGLSECEVQAIREFYTPEATNLPKVDLEKLNWHLPLKDVMKKVGSAPNDWEKMVTTDYSDSWWHDVMGYYDGTEKINTPALHMTTWFDISVSESIYEFNYFRENSVTKNSANNQFIIVAPATHCGFTDMTENSIIGELKVGDARKEWNDIYLKWFGYWLKGEDNGITDMPKVQYYAMGDNKWKSSDVWPLKNTTYKEYYLRSNGHANSRNGDGGISTISPGNEPFDSFVYDPGNPVPTVGGPRGTSYTTPSGSIDQTPVEIRNDVLVYTGEVLEEDLQVTGQLMAVFYVSSNAKDTDFTVKLVDVQPDGKAYNIQSSILRARYREGFTKKVWMEKDKVYKLEIDLNATSYMFKKGHRLRVQVSSSNFPLYDRNLNTGGNNYDETEWVVAKNIIHHSKRYPSHIVLPVIER
ncbi:CocE/NonD family hydrolase [Ulvibacterium sp.]|uniref:CocE/NonD family hydrolase n=1 Tax=Ulvibacterium sp. TaxID=2665914 RepID=UPI0026049161|nr:CocE/NonD family hydrolase [Ulvibacterium sp.]